MYWIGFSGNDRGQAAGMQAFFAGKKDVFNIYFRFAERFPSRSVRVISYRDATTSTRIGSAVPSVVPRMKRSHMSLMPVLLAVILEAAVKKTWKR
ncbi:hypothetical protein CR164_05960 [Prosthecochloris marina]|uniref:Uncharacterized protein n=1 Tax=Prosthecochloris marina TaxID=2017681 RepID=A0A317TAA5_9CHLB|nr:hypothetical protein CR164_05960 [Prosthecochloris marina]